MYCGCMGPSTTSFLVRFLSLAKQAPKVLCKSPAGVFPGAFILYSLQPIQHNYEYMIG